VLFLHKFLVCWPFFLKFFLLLGRGQKHGILAWKFGHLGVTTCFTPLSPGGLLNKRSGTPRGGGLGHFFIPLAPPSPHPTPGFRPFPNFPLCRPCLARVFFFHGWGRMGALFFFFPQFFWKLRGGPKVGAVGPKFSSFGLTEPCGIPVGFLGFFFHSFFGCLFPPPRLIMTPGVGGVHPGVLGPGGRSGVRVFPSTTSLLFSVFPQKNPKTKLIYGPAQAVLAPPPPGLFICSRFQFRGSDVLIFWLGVFFYPCPSPCWPHARDPVPYFPLPFFFVFCFFFSARARVSFSTHTKKAPSFFSFSSGNCFFGLATEQSTVQKWIVSFTEIGDLTSTRGGPVSTDVQDLGGIRGHVFFGDECSFSPSSFPFPWCYPGLSFFFKAQGRTVSQGFILGHSSISWGVFNFFFSPRFFNLHLYEGGAGPPPFPTLGF